MNKKKSFEEIELLADKFRADNNLSKSEPIRLKSLLLKNKILTVYKPLSSGFSGMSIKIGTEPNCERYMLINSEHPIGKQHFTICHELYHLYFQKDFTSATSCAGKFDTKGDPEEYNADVFASSLLIPREGILKMIPSDEVAKNKLSISTLLEIEHYYACSNKALLNRLFNLKFIDLIHKDMLSTGIVNNARKHGYNTDLYEKGNENVVIGDYGTLALNAFDNGLISESAYYTLLEDIGVDISKLEEEDNAEF